MASEPHNQASFSCDRAVRNFPRRHRGGGKRMELHGWGRGRPGTGASGPRDRGHDDCDHRCHGDGHTPLPAHLVWNLCFCPNNVDECRRTAPPTLGRHHQRGGRIRSHSSASRTRGERRQQWVYLRVGRQWGIGTLSRRRHYPRIARQSQQLPGVGRAAQHHNRCRTQKGGSCAGSTPRQHHRWWRSATPSPTPVLGGAWPRE